MQAITQLVSTQSELDDKRIALASGLAKPDLDGNFIILIQVPGVPNPFNDPNQDGRFLGKGEAWFTLPDPDDRISLYLTDEIGLTGQKAGAVIANFTDPDVPQENQGWFIPPSRGLIELNAVSGFRFVPAGFFIKIVGVSGSGPVEGKKLYVNLNWAKRLTKVVAIPIS